MYQKKYAPWEGWKAALLDGGYWLFALLYWECLLHFAVFGGFTASFGYGVGFTVCAALVLATVCSFLPYGGRFWIELLLSLVFAVLYGSQEVYYFIFGTLYSVAQIGQGGAALTSFWRETLSTMLDKLPWLLCLFVPLAVRAAVGKWLPDSRERIGLLWRLVMPVLAVVAFFGTEWALTLGGTEMFSDYDYYHSSTIATNQTAERFGLLTTFRLELFGSGQEEEETVYYIPEPVTEPTDQETQPQQEAEEKVYGYNVLDIDFDALNAQTDNKKLQAINDYCAQLTGTRKNAYTGLLEDYNLIVLCGESFSPAAIHPELTPTLYRMSQEGFIFQNYYNSFPNTTTDGEYALLQGLWPDSTRTRAASSLYASRNSYLPFTLGNAFSQQRDVQSFGYHNYRGVYYGRDESHPNMGYAMKFAGDGMTFTNNWPASDLEMMEQSVDDYIGQEQFHAYYMTFSGHYEYNTGVNKIAAKNWDLVKDLPYKSNEEKAYLSCNIELDKALEYLMARLEEAGVADRTAIVLTGDHFPYGLKDWQYSDMVGEEIDEFSKYKSSLIFWVGGMEEPVTVEQYCCNVDILPTLLNLWGLEYDSRMLAGTDVFSDGTHVAVLSNKSWLTDQVWFNAGKAKARYQVPEEDVAEGYIEGMNRQIATRFDISSDILNQAYYNFVFDKGEVKVSRKNWTK